MPEGTEPAEDGEPETPATAKASITQDADGKWNLHLDLSRIVLPTKEEVHLHLCLPTHRVLLHALIEGLRSLLHDAKLMLPWQRP